MRSIRVLALGVVGSCGFIEPRSDGESCERDEQCLSEACVGGICAFSSCDHTSQCREGFICDRAPTWAEALTFGIAQGVCDPTCDACPHTSEPRWTCHTDNKCSYDGTPWVDAGGPYTGVVGEPVGLVGTVELADGRGVDEAHWTLDVTTELGRGLEIDASFEQPGSMSVVLVVIDDAEMIGSAVAEVTMCSPEGGVCSYAEHCCNELECRDDDADGIGGCTLPAVCGDGVIEGAEECDGAPIPDADCTDYGQYHPGEVPCSASCTADLSACQACGETFDPCSTNADCCEGYVCDDFFGDCMAP